MNIGKDSIKKILFRSFITFAVSIIVFSCGNNEEKNRERISELRDSADIYYSRNLFGRTVNCCLEGTKLATQTNDTAAAAFFEYKSGMALFTMENYDASLMHFWDAIDIMRGTPNVEEKVHLGDYYMAVGNYHRQIMDYQKSFLYMDSAYVQYITAVNMRHDLENVINIDSLRGRIFIYQTRNLLSMEQEARSLEYLNEFNHTAYCHTSDGQYYYACYLRDKKMYNEALAILDSLQSLHLSEYVTTLTLNISDMKASVLYNLGRYQEAYDELDRYESMRHQMEKSYTNDNLLFQCNRIEQQVMVNKQKKDKEDLQFYSTLIYCAIAVIIGLTCIMFFMWRHYRSYITFETYKKHGGRKAAMTEDEYIDQKIKETIDNIVSQKEMEKKDRDTIALQTAKEVREENYRRNAINRFIKELKERKLYQNTNFKRDELIAELNLRRSTFNDDFEYVMHESFLSFLQRTRLEHAAELLRSNNMLTIDAIAQESGFAGRSTFYRLFSEQYGMSPAEFRTQANFE